MHKTVRIQTVAISSKEWYGVPLGLFLGWWWELYGDPVDWSQCSSEYFVIVLFGVMGKAGMRIVWPTLRNNRSWFHGSNDRPSLWANLALLLSDGLLQTREGWRDRRRTSWAADAAGATGCTSGWTWPSATIRRLRTLPYACRVAAFSLMTDWTLERPVAYIRLIEVEYPTAGLEQQQLFEAPQVTAISIQAGEPLGETMCTFYQVQCGQPFEHNGLPMQTKQACPAFINALLTDVLWEWTNYRYP